jgi:hypothetical protein
MHLDSDVHYMEHQRLRHSMTNRNLHAVSLFLDS